MTMPSFKYVRPGSVDEAIRLASADGARLHAGGTDLLGCLHDGVFDADTVVSLSGCEGLHGVRETADGGLAIGALTTVAQVAAHPLIRERYAALAQGASEVASPQLRRQGTLGGNLCQKPRCWYYRNEGFHCLRKGGGLCYAASGQNQFHALFGSGGLCYIVHPSDTAPALAAFDASVRVTGPKGRRTIPVAELHVPPEVDPTRETVLDPGEVVTEIVLPPAPSGAVSRYRKVRARRSWDFALAGVALVLTFDGDVVRRARVVLSGVAPVPWRAEAVEQALTGHRLDAATISTAADAAVEGAEPLEHNGDKVPLVRGMVTGELEALAATPGAG